MDQTTTYLRKQECSSEVLRQLRTYNKIDFAYLYFKKYKVMCINLDYVVSRNKYIKCDVSWTLHAQGPVGSLSGASVPLWLVPVQTYLFAWDLNSNLGILKEFFPLISPLFSTTLFYSPFPFSSPSSPLLSLISLVSMGDTCRPTQNLQRRAMIRVRRLAVNRWLQKTNNKIEDGDENSLNQPNSLHVPFFFFLFC